MKTDENIHPSKMVEILGDKDLAEQIEKAAIALYTNILNSYET